jgi:hypothetical protein
MVKKNNTLAILLTVLIDNAVIKNPICATELKMISLLNRF